MTGASQIDANLRLAIAGRRLVELTYKRDVRIVEPHDYGRRGGVVRLLAYQISGKSTTRPEWRLFDVARIEQLRVLDRTFAGSRGAAHRTHHEWEAIFARVE